MAAVVEQVDWLAWYERWERMMACYNPARQAQMHLLVSLPDLPESRQVRVLDLGAGPASTSLSVLLHLPRAEVTAVEADPVLVRMGQQVLASRGLETQVRYLQADLRDPTWWQELPEPFDLVVSATALHWLSERHYRDVCQRAWDALEPGGWFMNYDHVASANHELQERFNAWRTARAERAFAALEADRWDDYWRGLAAELCGCDLLTERGIWDLWEGSDDGQPKPVHLDALVQAGFELAEVWWQELGDAIVGGRRPGF